MYISRTIEKYIIEFLRQDKKDNPVIIIYGARQTGKTTLVKEILAGTGNRAEYFNCDYLDVQQLFSYQNISGIESYIRNKNLIVLDEAQRIENIGLVLKILYDHYPHLQIIATGSSSFELSNRINEPLTGRKRIFTLFPFSYEEVLHEKGILEQQRIMAKLLIYGLYPDVSLSDDETAKWKLNEIAGSYLFKDIFRFQDIRKPEMLMKLLQLLALQAGSEVSFRELSGALGMDKAIVQRYIHILEEAFVLFRLPAFGRNLRNEVTRTRKIYFWDIGLRNALIRNFNPVDLRNDAGAVFENFCIAERMKFKLNHQQISNWYFWRNYQKKEIDLIEEDSGSIFAFEFKLNQGKAPATPSEFRDQYPGLAVRIINRDNLHQFLL